MGRFWAMSAKEVLAELETASEGLTTGQVLERRARDGWNRLTTHPPIPGWQILLNQFNDFIIYLLLFAVLFSLAIGEYGDSTVILFILVMNGCIGFYQEYRASRSLEALKNMVQQSARVIRDGKVVMVGAEELVRGDILRLESGDRISADCRIIESVELFAEESVLTGESVPVAKQVAELEKEVMLADRSNMVFSSTSIASGRGTAVVAACGMETEIGRISGLVEEAGEEKTPLQQRLDRFGRNLGLVIIVICILVFVLCTGRVWLAEALLDRRVFLEFAFVAISLAVAAVPTALPAVVTIALSVGTRRLLAGNVLVRKLTSVETLGSCDVICSDKTGTLTRNRMTVKSGWIASGELDFDRLAEDSGQEVATDIALLLRIAGVCNNAVVSVTADKGYGGSPTEMALAEAACVAGVDCRSKRLVELPFDSGRKRMSVVIEDSGGKTLYTKGAPDRLLEICTHMVCDGKVVRLDDMLRSCVEEAVKELGSRAMRTMGFAYKENVGEGPYPETDLVFVGLLAMVDPPRKDVAESVRRAGEAGIRVIMITGDHLDTAVAVGKEIGIEGRAVTGRELDEMSDDELVEALKETAVFARVVPEHKYRIVRALQQNGHSVAMTGDGVNDAPALKKANIGIAVGSGTDVAREASDFVLLDDSFTSIVDAVEEGRGIYENIQKSIMLLLSGNLTEVLIVFLAVLFGFNLPLTALLLLWINLITDGAPALAYSIDPYGTGIMRRPPMPVDEGLLPGSRLKLLLGVGFFGSFVGLGLFHLVGGNSSDPQIVERARTMIFNYVVLYEMILVFVIRGDYEVPFCTNGWLWLAVVFSILIQGVIMYTPLNEVFHVTALDPGSLVQVIGAAGLFFCFAVFYRWTRKSRTPSRPA